MTESTRNSNLARQLFGAAVLACGLVMLVWHDYRDLDPLGSLLNATAGSILVGALGVVQILSGAAMQFRTTAKAGSGAIGALYLYFALLSVPQMLSAPQIFASWGNFFYPFAVAIGAAIVYARSQAGGAPKRFGRISSILMGISAASFTVEQVEFIGRTATLVPSWFPPGQMFWAIATCIPFGLAALALIINRMAVPASRLLSLMLGLFGVIVWVPLLLSDPRNHGNWNEATQTVAIAGAAWILGELLASPAAT